MFNIELNHSVLRYRDVAQLEPAEQNDYVSFCERKHRRGATIQKLKIEYRDVAQLGSAPRLGRGGRTFESCHPDH